jgi:hypothetical protein
MPSLSLQVLVMHKQRNLFYDFEASEQSQLSQETIPKTHDLWNMAPHSLRYCPQIHQRIQ